MSRAYIVMSYYQSPIYITHPKVKEAFIDRKKARQRVDELNKKATSNQYYIISVPMIEGNP